MHRSQLDCAEPQAAVPRARAEDEAIAYLDANGDISRFSPAAEGLFAAAGAALPLSSPGDFLLDPTGLPLSREFLKTFLREPALEPLRRSGTPLIARLHDGSQLQVKLTARATDDSGSMCLEVVPEQGNSEVFGEPPGEAPAAAAQGRRVLLRSPEPTTKALRNFCQSLVAGGYEGVAVFRAASWNSRQLRPIAWAQSGSGTDSGPDATDSIALALQSGRPVLGTCPPPWHEDVKGQTNVDKGPSCLALPVAEEGGDGIGVLVIAAEEPAAFNGPAQTVFAELAADLGWWLGQEGQPQTSFRGGEDEMGGILEATPDFLAVLDPDGRIRYLNSGALKMIGRPEREAWEGRPLTDFQPGTALRRFQEEALPAVKEQGSWRGETAIQSDHGAELPADQTLVAHTGPDGEVRSLFTIIRDISDRKREEARLRDSEEKYRRILEAAQEGFWIVHDQLKGDERPLLRYKVPVSKGSRIVLVDLPEVWYFQADGHYTQVFTQSESYLCNLSVSDLERRLDSSQFLRIHRSYIINLQHTQVLERMDDQWCVTIGEEEGERLPVSRRNVEKVKVMLGVS